MAIAVMPRGRLPSLSPCAASGPPASARVAQRRGLRQGRSRARLAHGLG
jgi:hypothetical protein